MGALANVMEQVNAQIAAENQAEFDALLAGYNIPQINPNAGIPQQYLGQSQAPAAQPSGGLMGFDSLMPMRAYREMYGRQGSPAQMQQNRMNYQGQYGSAESLAPMQTLNQYRQGNQYAAGTAPTSAPSGQPVSFGGK